MRHFHAITAFGRPLLLAGLLVATSGLRAADDAAGMDDLMGVAKPAPEPTIGVKAWYKLHPDTPGPHPSPLKRDPATVKYEPLSAELQGKFPITEPQYRGVDQLLLLSSRWLIVATRDVEAVVAKADELSGGTLLKAVNDWERSSAANQPNWTAYKKRGEILSTYVAQAREAIGEHQMDEPTWYTITSPDDPAYAKGQPAARVTRAQVSLDGNRVPGGLDIDYAQYSYLEMPAPLSNGKTYTITLGNAKAVTFTYDEQRTVSRAIKINQVGYLPSARQKYAYLGCWLQEFGAHDFAFAKTFTVINAQTGAVALTGEVKLREKASRFAKESDGSDGPLITGEDVYELDLGGLKDTGVFFISVPGVGRSWAFRHDPAVYGEVFYAAMRGLFHQRAAQELQEPYTAWTRHAFHTAPVYESALMCGPQHGGGPDETKGFERFDVVGATIDLSKPHAKVDGGWYDAADWDRDAVHDVVIFDLLTAYELAPQKFTDGQLNLPESGNGIPDILDECEYGLRVWKHSQRANGGVSGCLETWTHPAIDGNTAYAFDRPTRWNTLIYAAAAAQLAQALKPFNAKLAGEYQESALRAYAFGNDPKNSVGKVQIPAARQRGSGTEYVVGWEETDACSYPYLIHAKVRLYDLTGDASYLDGLAELSKKAHQPLAWRFSERDFSAWIFAGLCYGPAAKVLPPELVKTWRDYFLAGTATDANTMDTRIWIGPNEVRWANDMPYRFSWPRGRGHAIGWGDSVTTNTSRCLTIAHLLTGEPQYLDAILTNEDFMLGANPKGMCWTTGLGYVYPVVFQHEWSQHDGILDPIPGITIYGITDGPMYFQFRNNVWNSPTPDGKSVSFIHPGNTSIPVWRRYAAHPMANTAQCEFTVTETLAASAFTAAMLMPDKWQPSPALLHKLPREDRYLYGYWYLP